MQKKLSQHVRVGTDRTEAQWQDSVILHEALKDPFVAPNVLRRCRDDAGGQAAYGRRERAARYGRDIARFVPFAGNGLKAI